MVNSKDDLPVFADPSKEQQQQNHWLLSNLLPQGRSDSATTADNSPVRSREGARSPLSYQGSLEAAGGSGISPQQKPVNLLPEVPAQNNRKLSEREQRDCDVIGKRN